MNPLSRSLMTTAQVVCGEKTTTWPFWTPLRETVARTSSVMSTNCPHASVIRSWFSNRCFNPHPPTPTGSFERKSTNEPNAWDSAHETRSNGLRCDWPPQDDLLVERPVAEALVERAHHRQPLLGRRPQ